MRLMILVCVLLSLVVTGHVHAGCIRCKTKLVCVGDSKVDLITRCGQPYLKDTIQRYRDGYTLILDQWTYRPAAGQLYKIITLDGGKILHVEDGQRVRKSDTMNQ